MRGFGWHGLLVLVFGAAAAAPAAAEPTEYYFLKVTGRGAPISRIALNGTPLLTGTVISVALPVHVTRALRNGSNALEVEYVSDAHEGLTLTLERRRAASPAREDVAAITGARNETQGKRVKKSVTFTVKLPPAARPLTLTDRDREEIRRLIQAHYDALARKDADATARLYEIAVRRARPVYPEAVEFHQKVIDEAVRAMLANPAFRMRPLRLETLQFQVQGDVVVVERADRQPIFESEEVEVGEDVAATRQGTEGRAPEPSRSKLAPARLFFQRAQGRWHSTLPVLIL